MGIDSFIELLHEASHSHKNYRAAHNVTEVERSPRNEDMYMCTHQQMGAIRNEDMYMCTHQQTGAIRMNTRITIRNIG